MDWRLLVCLIFLAHLRVLRGIFFFFDYPRVDTFSFTKIGKPVSTGWILGFTICQGFACVRQMDVQGYELYFK